MRMEREGEEEDYNQSGRGVAEKARQRRYLRLGKLRRGKIEGHEWLWRECLE
jgi:hypothetical protein